MHLPARQAAFQKSAWALSAILAFLVCYQTVGFIRGARASKRQAMAMGRRETRRMAETIDALLRTVEPEVRSLAADLSAGKVPDGELQARIEKGLAKTPAAFRMGIDYRPFAKDPRKALFSIDVIRENGILRAYRENQKVNYAAQNWFLADMASEGWHEPHLSRTTFQVVSGFSLFIRKPGDPAGEPIGILRMDLSPGTIRQILSTATLGRTGYNFLLSPKGTFLAHPRHDWVVGERNVFQVAQETGDDALWRCGELALQGQPGEMETISYNGNQAIMLFSEPIRTAHWALESAVFAEDSDPSPVLSRRGYMNITCTILLLVASLGVASMGPAVGTLEALWRWHGLVSVLLAAGVSLIWGLALTYPDPPSDRAVPILSQEHLQKYLAARNPNEVDAPATRAFQVPTGVYLNTLRFDSNNNVVVTGLVWQRYPRDFPKELARGFIFPNAESLETTEAFHRQDARGDLVETSFKAALRQDFDKTVKYPFDQTVIRLPLWPRDFDAQVCLVPDLDSYNVLNPGSLPGVEKALVLPGWNKDKSYFGFLEPTYSTTFGAQEKNSAGRPPELSFQLTLSRQFLDPFISAMLPVIVVACLLYTLLMVGTKDRDRVRATGFSAINILAATATLLFPVIYAQISLRGRIASSHLLYLEYFYFVMYAVILLVAANALAFALGKNGLINLEDNALAKLTYWPVVLGTFFLISLIFLY
jgi:hypothetical protein